MGKFLELVAEEIELSADEIFKHMKSNKRRLARPTQCQLEMYWSLAD